MAWRTVRTVAVAMVLCAAACSDGGEPSGGGSGSGTEPPSTTATGTPGTPHTPSTTPTPSRTPTPTPTPTPAEFTPAAAMAVVEQLAGTIGPREAASPAFAEAAAYVSERLTRFGYDVTQVEVPVPAGDSWGVAVDSGTSANVIADPAGFDPTRPHVIIGAHLDSVPAAPGAEDNASGVAVLLELARMAAVEPPPIPVRFIAFGAEEPRGEGDDLHHFGSQQYVRELPDAHRRAIRAMVSLDRVGVPADHVPVCTGGTGTTAVRSALVDAAAAADVPVQECENRASDHWSFEKASIPAARLGSIPFAGYHSPDDVPSVVDPEQLERAGRITWAWLQQQ